MSSDSITVKNFLTMDLTADQLASYNAYLIGDLIEIDWCEPVGRRRDELLLLDLLCTNCTGDNWINISEEGICECSEGHTDYNTVLHYIYSHHSFF